MAVWQARTGQVKPGKGRDPLIWMQKIVSYVNDAYQESNYEVLTNIGGDLGQLHVISRFESLAQYEAFQAKLLVDEKYLAMVQDMWNAELFIAWNDHLYQVQK